MRNVSSKKTVVFLTVLALIAAALIPLAFARHANAATAPDWVDARGPGNGDAMAMVYDNVHGILYRATMGEGGSVQAGKGVWKYQAGTWTSLGGEVAALGINTLAYDGVGDCLYAGSNGGGVWCYDHSAGTWSETNAFMRVFYITSLAFGGGKLYAGVWDPNANSGLGAGKGVWSYDPAVPGTWTMGTGGTSTFRIESLAWGEGKLYAGCIDRSLGETAKGVWYYDPNSPAADKWTDTGGGMSNGFARSLVYDAGSGLLYSSAGFSGVWYYDPDSPAADKWSFTGGAAMYYEVTSLAWGEGKLYAGCNSLGPIVHNVVLCYDPASGETDKWTDTGGDMAAYQFPSLAFDTGHHYLYAGTTRNGVWRYDLSNSPHTWGDTRGGVSTSYIDSLAYDAVDNLLYVGTINDGVRCYNPATATWTDTGGAASTFETICLVFGGGKLYAGCYKNPTYMGVWCYDPASPAADKWTDTGGTAKAIRNLVYDDGRGLLYAGTGEYYNNNDNHGVWCYNPASPGWSDISSGDIDTFKIDSMALGGGKLYAGCSDPANDYVGVWYYDLDTPGPGWSNTGGSVSAFWAYSLAWGEGKLYAGCLDLHQPRVYWGQGVWSYDPAGLLPDKWSKTGGGVSTFVAYSLAWGEGKLYASCLNHTLNFDGVWGYDPASPDADKWTDTAGGVSSYYVSSLLYDGGYHRLYAGTGGMGAWYYGAPPVIDSLNPASATAGSEVTINGSCFGPGDSGSEYVTFGSVPAAVKPGSWTDTSVVCYVPAGASGNVQVTLHNLNGASNPVGFNVLHIEPTYTVTASVSGIGGQVSPLTQEVALGGTASINITPDAGYHIASITDNGAPQTLANPYIISNVSANQAVVVTFESDNYTFYFAEGYTGQGFQEYLCMCNPDATAANTLIAYMFPDGTSQTQKLSVAGNSRSTVDVNAAVGSDKSVSAKITSDRPIVLERPMYFNYQGKWSGGHDAVGATAPATTWYFAEGYTGPGFDEYICVLNPGGNASDLTFRFQTQEAGEITKTGYSVGPHTRGTFKVNDVLGPDYQTSLKLESSQPVVAERPMYFNYQGAWTGGHCVMGTPELSKGYYFAEGTTRTGFHEWLTLQNPNTTPITVDAVYQLGAGQGANVTKSYTIGAGERATVFVEREVGTEKDVSVKLTGDSDFLAERPMYFNYQGAWTGGHCVIGASTASPQWFFAEGYTGSGFHEWLCLQNPGTSEATVEITYLTQETGALPVRTTKVPAGSRQTVFVNTDAGEGYQLSACLQVTAGPDVVVERPMYFNYSGKWTGGHDVVGYMP